MFFSQACGTHLLSRHSGGRETGSLYEIEASLVLYSMFQASQSFIARLSLERKRFLCFIAERAHPPMCHCQRAHPPLCKSSGTANRSHSQHFCWHLELNPGGTVSFLINTQLYKICGTVFLEFHHIFSYHQIIPGCKINTWKHNSFSF